MHHRYMDIINYPLYMPVISIWPCIVIMIYQLYIVTINYQPTKIISSRLWTVRIGKFIFLIEYSRYLNRIRTFFYELILFNNLMSKAVTFEAMKLYLICKLQIQRNRLLPWTNTCSFWLDYLSKNSDLQDDKVIGDYINTKQLTTSLCSNVCISAVWKLGKNQDWNRKSSLSYWYTRQLLFFSVCILLIV